MRLLLPLALAALLIAAGCSKDKDVEPPAALVKFPATLPVKNIWGDNRRRRQEASDAAARPGPAVDNGLVFAGSDQGELLAVSLDTGKQVWVKKLEVAPIRRAWRGSWAWWWSARARVR